MSTPTITLYGIPNCDTVKKARTWLTDQNVTHQFHDFKKQGVPVDHLPQWIQAVGWERLVNRQGTTWRKLDTEVQARVQDAASASALMVEHPSVIKRPVVEWGTISPSVTVGFDAQSWNEALAALSNS